MSLFGDIDIDELGTGPEAGTYPGTVKALDMNKMSKANKKHVVIDYDIDNANFDFPVSQWFKFPENLNPASWDDTVSVDKKGNTEADLNRRSIRFLTRTLMSIGVPKERLNSVTEDDLIGVPVLVTVEINEQGFPNVKKVVGRETENAPAPTVASDDNPFD